ncbi:MAG: GGDEF domain-containing protein [bacterium]|nr:GGDEF domain-containing protein [bacterium]
MRNIKNNDSSGNDLLTGFCNFNAAAVEIKRILMSGTEKYHSVLLFKIKHIKQIEEVYGKAFAGAVIENAAIYINYQYRGKGQRVVLGRIRHDTFMVFQCAAEPETVEEIADRSCIEMNRRYYGRNTRIRSGMTAGICHMSESVGFDEALLCAERALQYAEHYNKLYEVYDVRKKYSDIRPIYKNVLDDEETERALNYDNRFVSFAVAMLASAKDPDSSLDLLIQRIGWQFDLNHVMINIFENSHYARVTNHYEKGRGIIVEQNLIEDMDSRDGFFQHFDSNGCMKVKDTFTELISERDRAYYNKYNMRAVINFLMYDNDKLIGYVSYSASEAKNEWNQSRLNTLMQISRIFALFVTMRIHKERDERRYESLSIDALTGLSIYTAFLETAKKRLY